MDFESILEDLHASTVENLLPKFTSVNFGKSEIYPGKSGSFHRDTETGCFNGSPPLCLFFS